MERFKPCEVSFDDHVLAGDMESANAMATYAQDIVKHAVGDSMKPCALVKLKTHSALSAADAIAHCAPSCDTSDSVIEESLPRDRAVPAGQWIRRLMAMLPQQISRYVP